MHYKFQQLADLQWMVPQILFIDAVVFEQFQFLDKFMVGPLLCNDSSLCSLGCSTLTSVDVLV